MKDRLRTKAIFQVSKILWHLDIFRRSFRELSGHTCMLDSCIFCALKELFSQLQFSHEIALPPDALRRALAESFFDHQRFQLGFMDDAAECFENILLRIHFHLACGEAEDLCNARHCIPHVKFAMTLVEQSVCGACGATSEPLPFTQMVHYVSASALISQAKQSPVPSHPDLFGHLLKKAGGMGDIRDCPSACGAKIQIRRTLTNHPEIISVGIVWDSERPSLEQVLALLGTLRTSLRLSDVFHTPNPSPTAANPHQLVGIVTYYGKHYSTFFFHTKLKMWIYFDDTNVREVGPKWEQVVDKCRRGRYQPLLLLFAFPDGTPVDPSTAPKLTTIAPAAKPPLGRRSLTPSPEKPSLGTVAQRRAVTPNPEQTHGTSHPQCSLQVLNDYQNLPGLAKVDMWSRKELVRRDSGNWSGDRNSASSSSSTSLENPYQYILGKVQNRTHKVPRSPTSLKGSESSSGGSQCDPGYDSFSLSSTDSLPLQQSLKHSLQLAQIPEGHQSPASLIALHFPQKKALSECERLCEEADILLKHSQATDDLEVALTYANAAVGKARQAMDAPYSNPQTAAAARMKHSTCIMQARSIHKRIEEPNGPRHGEGRHSREGSGCSGRGSTGSHSRQGSKDKGNHSRQNSKELPELKPPEISSKISEEISPEKNIEIYATLPKSRKGLLSRVSCKVKNTIEDEEYLMYDRPGRSLGRNKPPNGKKDDKRARSEERNSKSQKEKEFISNRIPKEQQIKAEEQKQGKKQHKVRRKLLMGGLIRRKNRSMPDLREDELTVKGGTKDDSSVGKIEKQPTLSGYLSEGHLEYTGNPNLEKSKLMRKSLHGSKLIQMAKVPPPPPLRTTSQLSKERQFQITDNLKENKLSLWKEPEPQSLPSYSSCKGNPEAVTYANGGYLINNCQTKLVTTAQVHQVSSPDKEFNCNDNDDDAFDLPPYPSPLNSVSHSRQASEDFPPPPNELVTITSNSLLEQLQRKREQILNDQNTSSEVSETDQIKLNELWLSELQAKQAVLKNCEFKQNDSTFPHDFDKLHSPQESLDSISIDIGKRLDDQMSTVRDLKSKFESISLNSAEKPIKISENLAEKNKINSLTVCESLAANQSGSKQNAENPMRPAEGEIKSSLANNGVRSDYLKRKPSKKKNVTFCEQVVLVATAEDDKVNSYIPNPILERVLRSVLHRDFPHQEAKEIAVHSVVPLKRNDSGNYGQCVAKNQPEPKASIPDETDSVVVQDDKTSEDPENEKISVDSSNNQNTHPFSCQRTLMSPVPNRQPNRMQTQYQMVSLNQNPYQPLPANGNQSSQIPPQSSNLNLPHHMVSSLQYQSDDQSLNLLNKGNNWEVRQLTETDNNKFSQYNTPGQPLSALKGDFNNPNKEIDHRTLIQENNELVQHGLPNVVHQLYNSNLMNNSTISSHQIISATQNNNNLQNPSPISHLQPHYSPVNSTNYSLSNNVLPAKLVQQKTPSTNHIYQHLPTSVAFAHQQQLGQTINSSGQILTTQVTAGRQPHTANPLGLTSSVMQRNLSSPNFHNQMQTSTISQGVLASPHSNHFQLAAHQNQRNLSYHLSNGSPHQIKNSPLPSNVHNDQMSYLANISHHPSNTQNQQSIQLTTYPSHVSMNVPNVSSQQNSIGAFQNHVTHSDGISSEAAMNQVDTHTTNMPSPSPSFKSQMLNLTQMPIHNLNNLVAQIVPPNGQNCFMPQKMRQPILNGGGGSLPQVPGKGRPQGMYQPESPIQECTPQNMNKKEMPNLRNDVYQRVPNLLHSESFSTQIHYPSVPLSPHYQSPPSSGGPCSNPQTANPQNTNQQALPTKYSPYQHPPIQWQGGGDIQKVLGSSGRTSMCNLCRKKQIVLPSMYCVDCDFYMSRFKPRT